VYYKFSKAPIIGTLRQSWIEGRERKKWGIEGEKGARKKERKRERERKREGTGNTFRI